MAHRSWGGGRGGEVDKQRDQKGGKERQATHSRGNKRGKKEKRNEEKRRDGKRRKMRRDKKIQEEGEGWWTRER
eukprot:scaffold155436_cov30-Tisochrysis_lutea.AAC.4